MYSKCSFKQWLFKEFTATTNWNSKKILKSIDDLFESEDYENLYDEWRVNLANRFYQAWRKTSAFRPGM
jgi:hypothetical protein